MLGSQPIFTIHAELEPIMNLGHTPFGERRSRGGVIYTVMAGLVPAIHDLFSY
jgi:hypothetical protein